MTNCMHLGCWRGVNLCISISSTGSMKGHYLISYMAWVQGHLVGRKLALLHLKNIGRSNGRSLCSEHADRVMRQFHR
jgi:hypothetical protein